MFRGILAAVLMCPALPAVADCVTADSLKSGVVFHRADGQDGLAIARDGGVFIDYATGPTGIWTDERQTRLGIYEAATVLYHGGPDAVGGGDLTTAQTFRGKPPVPQAGTAWTGKARYRYRQENSSESGGYRGDNRYEVTFAYLAEKTVRLSGCKYRVIPVEAVYSAVDDGFSQRWLYFPDLGFGLETRTDETDNGLIWLKPR